MNKIIKGINLKIKNDNTPFLKSKNPLIDERERFIPSKKTSIPDIKKIKLLFSESINFNCKKIFEEDYKELIPLLKEIEKQGRNTDDFYKELDFYIHPDFKLADGLDKKEVLKTTLAEIAYPQVIFQGRTMACAAATAQSMLSLKSPSDYLKLVRLLSSEKGDASEMLITNPGVTLERVPDSIKKDKSGRTISSQIIESAFIKFAVTAAVLEFGPRSLIIDEESQKYLKNISNEKVANALEFSIQKNYYNYPGEIFINPEKILELKNSPYNGFKSIFGINQWQVEELLQHLLGSDNENIGLKASNQMFFPHLTPEMMTIKEKFDDGDFNRVKKHLEKGSLAVIIDINRNKLYHTVPLIKMDNEFAYFLTWGKAYKVPVETFKKWVDTISFPKEGQKDLPALTDELKNTKYYELFSYPSKLFGLMPMTMPRPIPLPIE